MTLLALISLTDLLVSGPRTRIWHHDLSDLASDARKLQRHHQGPDEMTMRSSLNSLVHWLALCATVEGASKDDVSDLVAAINHELEQAIFGHPVTSAPAQNFYLDPKIGVVDSLRAAVMANIKPRTVHSGGALAPRKSKSLPARRSDESPHPSALSEQQKGPVS